MTFFTNFNCLPSKKRDRTSKYPRNIVPQTRAKLQNSSWKQSLMQLAVRFFPRKSSNFEPHDIPPFIEIPITRRSDQGIFEHIPSIKLAAQTFSRHKGFSKFPKIRTKLLTFPNQEKPLLAVGNNFDHKPSISEHKNILPSCSLLGQDPGLTQAAPDPRIDTSSAAKNTMSFQAPSENPDSGSNAENRQDINSSNSTHIDPDVEQIPVRTPPVISPSRDSSQSQISQISKSYDQLPVTIGQTEKESRKKRLRTSEDILGDKDDKLKRNNEESRKHNEQLRKHNEQLRKHNEDLRKENEVLKQKNDEAETKETKAVMALQELNLESMKSGKWLPSTNNDVDRNIRNLKRAIKQWTKEAVISGSQVSDPEATIRNREHLEKHRQEFLNFMMPTEEPFANGLVEQKFPKVLLEALLAHQIFVKIFSFPFFVFRTRSCSLDEVYRQGLSWSFQDAHRWRSDTLRLVFPEDQKDQKVNTPRKSMQTLFDEEADHHASYFTESYACCLFNVNAETTTKLRNLYHQAISVSYNLWTRRRALKISTLKDLNPSFDINDPKMTLHSMVNEDTEDELTGDPITLVVQPAIEEYGTEERDDAEASRIWAPAEVWFYKPLPQEPPRTDGVDTEMNE